MNNSSASYYEKGNAVFKNILALIGIIGIVFNILAICVFQRKKLKKNSYSFYWKVKALIESFILLQTFQIWARFFFKADIKLISPFFCYFNDYLAYVASLVTMWLDAIITLDRFLTLVYSNRFTIIKKRSFQIVILLIVFAYCLLININMSLNFRLEIGKNGTLICHTSIETLKKSWVIFLLNTLIVNLLFNPILDMILIKHVIKTRINARRLSRITFVDRKFAISSICLNINCLLLKLPFVINNLLSAYLKLKKEQTEFTYQICLCLTMFEKCDIFLVNILVNSIFRQEFYSMFGFKIANNSNDLIETRRPSKRISLTTFNDDFEARQPAVEEEDNS